MKKLQELYFKLCSTKMQKEIDRRTLDAEINVLDNMIHDLKYALEKEGVVLVREHFEEVNETQIK